MHYERVYKIMCSMYIRILHTRYSKLLYFNLLLTISSKDKVSIFLKFKSIALSINAEIQLIICR